MISFIIPAYNEEAELPGTIAAIRMAAAGVGEPHEIVVVDDASTDATARIATEAGAMVVQIDRRHIAAARNAGARAAQGEILFFVDADTRITPSHIVDGIAVLKTGYAGGGARVQPEGQIPLWARVFTQVFCALYFGSNLGAGAFLFTTRDNFEKAGGFDEQYFAGEEIFFTMALKKLGRFKLLREPVLTSARKMRMHSAGHILSRSFAIIIRGPRSCRSRDRLDLWYDGKRETNLASSP